MAQQITVEKNNTKDSKAKVKVSLKFAEAHARFLRVSPRKMRLVTNLVKNMHASDAIQQLQFTPKKGAAMVINLIKSAVANAENNFKLNKDNLYIKSITCDSGPKLKRFMPRAQGRATEIRRPTSHLHIVLEEKQSGKKRRTIQFNAKPETAVKTLPDEEVKKGEKPDEKSKVPGRNLTDKTNEQMKSNKVQQKRRLFNRKSGV